MVFSSSVFLFLFFPVLLALYYCPAVRKRETRNLILVLFSIIFYAWGEPVYVLLLLLNICVNHRAALFIEKAGSKARGILLAGICYNVLILFVFKYLDFAAGILSSLFGSSIKELGLPLPIGISFYSFQAISYLVDVYRKRSRAQKGVLNVALYIAFFPQLVAGPIVRYETISREIAVRNENWHDIAKGLTRFIAGLSKKVLLANVFGILVDKYWSSHSISMSMAWLLAISYTFQIYFDFSGYSDMAIGLGGVFGFHFEENFRYPYSAKSVTDFWRRWHISLGSWFKDYIYIPLGGNRVPGGRHFFNIFAVWLLTGIWHGANWTFIVWGMLYFIVLLAEKTFVLKRKAASAAGHVYTMLIVILAWVIFRSDNITEAAYFIKNMFGMGNPLIDNTFLIFLNSYKWYLLAGLAAALPLKEKIAGLLAERADKRVKVVRDAVYVSGMLLLVIANIATIVKGSYNPFIYFNF